jgi:type VI secretion system protein ImpA
LVSLDVFLAPLDADNPSGAELRNDPRFLAIERLLEPGSREARTEASGTAPSVTSDVDWDAVLSQAEELAGTGRDLRLLVVVTRALANEGGIDPEKGYLGYAGLASGLDMIARNVTEFWDSLHPELRDSTSPREAGLRRLNALMQLENDDHGLLGDLEMNAVIEARGLGIVTGADLAAGTLTENDVLREGPSGLGTAEEAKIVAAHEERVHKVEAVTRALAAEQPEVFEALNASRAAARAGLDSLAEAVNGKLGLGPGEGLRFAEISKFLDRVGATLDAAGAHVAEEASAAAPASGDAPSSGAAPVQAQGARPGASYNGGGINSREEVERALDMIIAFYERTEPASPIPHLARRMRRMVPMDFMELMEEIAPGGLKEFRSVAGVPEDKRK